MGRDITGRYKAVVLSMKEEQNTKLLFVSWHGLHNNETVANRWLYLKTLQQKAVEKSQQVGCKSIVIGGDFNVPIDKCESQMPNAYVRKGFKFAIIGNRADCRRNRHNAYDGFLYKDCDIHDVLWLDNDKYTDHDPVVGTVTIQRPTE